MTISEFFVKLGLDVNAQSFAKGQLAVEGLKLGLRAVVGVAREVTGFLKEAALGTAEYADTVDETAQSAGVTTDAIQELAYAGSFSSLTMEDMAQSIGFLSKNMVEATSGNKDLKKTFQQLGVPLKNADGTFRSSDEVLGQLADKFKAMPNGVKKTSLSMQVFGKSGKKMIPLLNEGSAGLARLREEAHKSGNVLDGLAIQTGRDTSDSLDTLGKAWNGVKLTIGAKLLPILKTLADSLGAWLTKNRELIAQRVGQFVDGVVFVFRALGTAIAFVIDNSRIMVPILTALAVAFGALKIAAAAAWIAAIPGGPIIAGLAAIAAAVALIVTHWDEITAAIERAQDAGKDFLEDTFGEYHQQSAMNQAASKAAGFSGKYSSFDDNMKIKQHIERRAAMQREAAAGPSISASAGQSGANISAPMNVTINQQPGQSGADVADAFGKKFNEHWYDNMAGGLAGAQ
jgi:hypothetical protein